ncbi:MAG: glycine--tRNA ligase subunit beta, partial [Kiloniellaceae bacterium]
ELLLELLSEEIPARMQARGADNAADKLREKLLEMVHEAGFVGVDDEDVLTLVTPRRLTGVVRNLPPRQPDVTWEKKGPRLDAPEDAIQGFLKANGLKTVDDAEVRETAKGKFLFAVKRVKGRPTKEVLAEQIPEIIYGFDWPKSMRWSNTAVRWVRPLRGVLCVFDGRPLKGGVGLASSTGEKEIFLSFTNTTVGHRFLAPKPFKVKSFADYQAKLRAAKVILDPAERRAEILKQAKRRAARAKLKLKDDPDLLDEVTGLVEWPVVLMGRIDEHFMDLPPEVLTTAMRAHQKYLALLDENGKPADRFLVVANMETADRGRAIVAGNERVLRARLADARFFWDHDRKAPLASLTTRLREIVFHERLGTLGEKMDRVQALATGIADHVPGADKDRVRSAARLAKADLVTGMVGEFPELQGIMGRYYALADGEHPEVAQAIAEHYAPLGPSDACPKAPVSVAVALADKIDTLVGFFAIGETPTGSKDPYALRRAALGVIRLIVENKLRIPLLGVFSSASKEYTSLMAEAVTRALDKHGHPIRWSKVDLLDFIADRLKVALRDKGVRHDLISAVFAVGGEDDLVRLLARVEALETFLKTDDGANLLVAYQRAANIVRIEEKRDRTAYRGEDLRLDRLVENEEKRLAERILASEEAANGALAVEDFTGAMAALAKLRRPVDEFFDRVTVNTQEAELRANRLRLLARIRATLDRVADFSKIEG